MRSRIFWLSDLLKGAVVWSHLRDVKDIMEGKDPFLEQKILKRLRSILNHASATASFYEDFDPIKGISAFPIIDKNVIREKLSSFLSNKFMEKHRIPAVTSGSTGTPFRVFQSLDKKRRNTADMIYFATLAGYILGNKLYYFKIWSDYNKKSSFTQRVQNIVPIDVLNLKEQATRVIKELNSNHSPVNFLGYVSAFETLCRELDRENILSRVKVNSIITMSESLNEYTKNAVEKYFSCPVLSRYSNIENGIIAQQTLTNRAEFTINRASYYVEILDLNKNELVPNGVLGRIVVTDYFNYVMPLIRYDTGDLGVLEDRMIDGVKQQVLTKIEGRKLDQIFNTKGDLVSSYIVYKNMWNYTEIEQYQLIQKSVKEYLFRICMKSRFEREAQLIAEFRKYLGEDSIFKIEYVDDIPLLSSGKRKKVVNEMHIS